MGIRELTRRFFGNESKDRALALMDEIERTAPRITITTTIVKEEPMAHLKKCDLCEKTGDDEGVEFSESRETRFEGRALEVITLVSEIMEGGEGDDLFTDSEQIDVCDECKKRIHSGLGTGS